MDRNLLVVYWRLNRATTLNCCVKWLINDTHRHCCWAMRCTSTTIGWRTCAKYTFCFCSLQLCNRMHWTVIDLNFEIVYIECYFCFGRIGKSNRPRFVDVGRSASGRSIYNNPIAFYFQHLRTIQLHTARRSFHSLSSVGVGGAFQRSIRRDVQCGQCSRWILRLLLYTRRFQTVCRCASDFFF